jgi:hypothetical protein
VADRHAIDRSNRRVKLTRTPISLDLGMWAAQLTADPLARHDE